MTATADERPARRWLARSGCVLLAAGLGVYELLLLGNFHLALIAPEQLDRAFGSMLRHLLHGDAGVGAGAIGFESFTRDGRTLTYFGIFPAMLRLLAMPFTDVTRGGLSRLSCLAAMLLFVMLQLRTLWLVHHAAPARQRSMACLAIMATATCLSGPQIYLLGSATIYHEPIFWAGAMGAGYNLILLRAVLDRGGPDASEMAALAVLAGLAVNTRASVGAALCLTTGLLVLRQLWLGRKGMVRAVLDGRVIWPVLVLAVLVGVAGWVNYVRWGSPLRFADFRYYDFAHRQPQRLAEILRHGELNPVRIPVGLLYYATGIPYVLKSVRPFAGLIRTWFDGIEAPPFSGLMADPLTVLLAAVGIYRIARAPPWLPVGGVGTLRLALLGHASAVILVCSAMYLAMRYRMDFAPFMTLAGWIGYPTAMRVTASASRRHILAAWAGLCVLGIVGSHYLLLVHKVWSNAVPMDVRLLLLPYAPFARAALQ